MQVGFIIKNEFVKRCGWGLEELPLSEWWKKTANLIILSLYKLDEKLGVVVDEEKLKKYGLDKEPINWGNLSCVRIEGNTIYIEEASPNAVNLQKYIQDWFKKWGWDVEVKTEW